MAGLEKINRSEAFRYMGVSGVPDEKLSAAADECEKRLLSAAAPKFCWTYAEISGFAADGITLKGHRLTLRGKDIAEHLSGCFGVVLLCATLGNGTDKLLRTVQAEDMAKALVCDAMASAAVEQVCDGAEEEIRKRFTGRFMTWRFSPGYGDFPLDTQKDFLAAANAEKLIGLCVSSGGILTPTKSVTAVIGISETPVEPKKRGCGSCQMREKCLFRKTGGHCGE